MIAVITNPVQYLIALAAGALVGCLVLSLLKKPLPPRAERARQVGGRVVRPLSDGRPSRAPALLLCGAPTRSPRRARSVPPARPLALRPTQFKD